MKPVKNSEKSNKKKIKLGFGHKLFMFILAIIIFVCSVCFGLLAGITVGCVITTSPLDETDLIVKGISTTFYDSDGKVMQTITTTSSTIEYVSIDQIPLDLQHAFVAIEDERFYEHNGVDVKRTASAVIGFLVPGMSSHGGSTITQQLVKNITGDDSRSVPRKIREQWRAIQLEKMLNSKDKIIELYLNKIYFANSCYGIQAAANKYFDKDVSELTLAECAFLAGITNNPAKYNPATTSGRQNAYKRQIIILDNMLDQGYITSDQYIEAIQTELVFDIDRENDEEETTESNIYSYFVDTVIKEVRNDLMEKGYTKAQANNLIYNQGISIYTTQDTSIQDIVDEVFTNNAYFRVNGERDPEDCAQAGITVMDQYTGKVVAIYGGYGEKTSSLSYNRATDIARQPGSSIKPLLVYGPLIDKKIITAGTAMDEVAVALDPQNPDKIWPSNWDNYVHGYLNARYALAKSYNIPAATWFKNNIPLCIDYCKRCGIDKSDEPYLSTALGGFKNGVSPLEMSAGYSVISNGGVYYEPIFYTKVYSASGELLLDNTINEGTQVYDNPETADILTSMLETVVYGAAGTGGTAKIYYDDVKLPLAGKTGSTTDLVDYWFCGFTSYYTAAVWYGYDDSSSISEKLEGGSAMIIWKAVMSKIHENLPIKDFDMSSKLVTAEICTASGKRATEACKYDNRAEWVYTEYYIKGTEPDIDDVCTCHTCITVCTECKDEFGKYCIATPKCIENGTTKEVYGLIRDKESYEYILATIELDERYKPTDWSRELSLKYCNICDPTFVPPGEERPEVSPSPTYYDGDLIPTPTPSLFHGKEDE